MWASIPTAFYRIFLLILICLLQNWIGLSVYGKIMFVSFRFSKTSKPNIFATSTRFAGSIPAMAKLDVRQRLCQILMSLGY